MDPTALSDIDDFSSDKSAVESADSDEQFGGLANVSISDDDRPGDLVFWFSGSESGGQRRSRRKRQPQTKGAPVSITDRPCILSEQRDYVTDQLSPHIS